MEKLSEEGLKARRAYQAAWLKKNKEHRKAWLKKYWERKAEEAEQEKK